MKLAPQGVIPSDRRTPFSLASCSNVMGINEPVERCGQSGAGRPCTPWELLWSLRLYLPIPQMTKTSAAKP